MSFAWPLALLGLLVVPLALGGFALAQRRRMRYAVAFTNLDVLAAVVEPRSAWRRYVPPALFLLALAALAAGLARPHVTVSVPREDATVVLVVDTSGSMFARDVRPTRLGAAQQAMQRFLDRVPGQFRIGLMAFAAEPQLVSPPTRDRAIVRDGIEFLFPQRGTAIGDALARAAEVARDAVRPGAALEADDPPATILFLSDGSQTEGWLQPLEGARRAKQLGIKVYTVALGTPDGVVELSFGTGFERVIPVPPDPITLRQVAQTTGGAFFEAPTAEALTAAYEKLGSQVSRTREPREATFAFLGGAAALAFAAGALSLLWSARIP